MNRATVIVLIFCLGLSACKDNTRTITCSATLSFSHDIIPILQTNCTGLSCHSGSNPPGHFQMDSAVAYQQLSTKGYFIAGNPIASPMYQKMVSTSDPMPPTGLLSNSSTAKIYCWIEQGGLNN